MTRVTPHTIHPTVSHVFMNTNAYPIREVKRAVRLRVIPNR